ncbi:ATP-binding protein [Desulforhopalus sp. IMCC35007]|uniref:PAS domain-containing sensor histidine kinase n=1 Tax=Desulforhopalus sp. IMCC35007 TaxID=2569543 RepID=UPI0010AE911E|nr:ATP-binding protein [Desulforhopalus sp. IMCC35007]TKB09057.1 PAS domain-containing protein [Desulforhopalus sp. IMCC35007]
MNGKRVNRIAGKLVFWLVVVSSSLTLLTAVAQLYFDYHDSLDRISSRLGQVTEKHVPELNRLVLQGDSQSVNNVLKRIMDLAPIAYAAVIVDDQVFWERGNRNLEHGLVSNQPFWINRQKELNAGVLTVATDITPVREYIFHKFIQTLVSNGVKIFIVAGFVFLMFQYLVTRHLEEIARQIRLEDITRRPEPIALQRRKKSEADELDMMVTGLNAMRDKARIALKLFEENEERLLQFFDATKEAIIGIDRLGFCSFANDAAIKVLEKSDYNGVVGQHVDTLFTHQIHSDHKDYQSNIVSASMELGSSRQSDEGYLVLSPQKIIPVSIRSYPVFQVEKVSGAIIFIEDNSEKRQLLHEHELLNQAVEQSPLMVIIADAKKRIEYVNQSTVRWSGFTRDEILGRSLLTFVNLSGGTDFSVRNFDKQLRSGNKWEGVVRAKSKWGSVQLFCIISPVFDDRGRIVNIIGIYKEVSYETALQDELINTKKMEAVNRLSASFAHEFGNPLFGVRAVIKDLSERLVLEEDDKVLLHLASVECEKMRTMVREFQEVYFESKSPDLIVDIYSVIDSVLGEIRLLLQSEGIHCTVELEERASQFQVSKNKLTLVIRNIVLNSIEAMERSGGHLHISGQLDGNWMIIGIKDTGQGIEKELQELVFEPFFSTKPQVEGAGLGLSVAYGTMKSIGGKITFSSVSVEGSTFFIHIPIV